MNTEEFNRRRDAAREEIEQSLLGYSRRSNASLLEVCNTNAGGSEHTYRIEQRRRHNGQIERAATLTYANVKEILDELEKARDAEELWKYIASEVRMTVLPGRESIARDDNTGIDWEKARHHFNKSPKLPHAYDAMEARLKALHAIYRKFWV